jgi:serine/threonine protein kinase
LFKYPTVELVLAAIKATCGPFPQWMLQQSPLSRAFFTESGCTFEIDPPQMPRGTYLIRSVNGSSVRNVLHVHVNADIFGDLDAFKAFLEMLLTIDPRERPDAASACHHNWLTMAMVPFKAKAMDGLPSTVFVISHKSVK